MDKNIKKTSIIGVDNKEITVVNYPKTTQIKKSK